MTQRLQNKVAIITGGSGGIGKVLSVGLAKAGATVAVLYKNDRASAEQVCQEIHTSGGQADPFQCDVGSRVSFTQVIDDVVAHYGKLNILVNNAGRTRFGPIEEATEEDFDDVVNTVLRGPFFGSIAAAKHMKNSGGGSIINISSIAVRAIIPYHGVYTTCKGGLEAMTRQMALELAPHVRVNVLAPTATSMARNTEYNPKFDERWGEANPLGRVATPADYVGPCVFLASNDSEMVNGQLLYVDGGWANLGAIPKFDDMDFSADRTRDDTKTS